MKRLTRKNLAAIAVTGALVLGGGGVAFAYFTSGGGGTGSADVGSTGASDFAVTTTGPTTALLPGDGGQPFDVSIHNTGDTTSHIGTVYLSIATYAATTDAATAAGADIPGCSASWFAVTPSIVVDHSVPVGSTMLASGLGLDLPTISLTETGTDQDACQGASVGIAFSTVDPG
jgi:hypothetical protein